MSADVSVEHVSKTQALRDVREWLRTGGAKSARESYNKVVNYLRSTFADPATISKPHTKFADFLLPLYESASPILFLACCCNMNQEFMRRPRPTSATIQRDVVSFLQLNPRVHMDVPINLWDLITSIEQIQNRPAYKIFLQRLQRDNHIAPVPDQVVPNTLPFERNVSAPPVAASIAPPPLQPPQRFSSQLARSQSTLSAEIAIKRSLTSPVEPPVFQDHIDMLSSESTKEEILAALTELHLPDCGDVPLIKDGDREAWSEWCLYPEVYRASECWTDNAPPLNHIDAWTVMLQEAHSSRDIIFQSKGIAISFETYMTRVMEGVRNPLALDDLICMNIPTTNNPQLLFPESSHAERRANLRENEEVYLRPSNRANRGSIVKFHVDGGADGLAALIDPCVKVWFMAPPTPHNMKVSITSRHCLEPEKYQHVIMLVQTSKEVVQIPAGCLHATVTVVGGTLTGVTFSDYLSIKGSVPALLYTMSDPSTSSYLVDDFGTFCTNMELALKAAHEPGEEARRIWRENWKQIKDLIDKQSPAELDRWKIRPHDNDNASQHTSTDSGGEVTQVIDPWNKICKIMEYYGCNDHRSSSKRKRRSQSRGKSRDDDHDRQDSENSDASIPLRPGKRSRTRIQSRSTMR